jgi:hypothetical protein
MHRRDGYAAIAYLTVLVAATFVLGVLIADEGNAQAFAGTPSISQAR